MHTRRHTQHVDTVSLSVLCCWVWLLLLDCLLRRHLLPTVLL